MHNRWVGSGLRDLQLKVLQFPLCTTSLFKVIQECPFKARSMTTISSRSSLFSSSFVAPVLSGVYDFHFIPSPSHNGPLSRKFSRLEWSIWSFVNQFNLLMKSQKTQLLFPSYFDCFSLSFLPLFDILTFLSIFMAFVSFHSLSLE